jgi:hypothetical protein
MDESESSNMLGRSSALAFIAKLMRQRAEAANNAQSAANAERVASEFARFLVLGSVAVTNLIVAPILWFGIRTPDKPTLSPPMVLWIAGVILAWCATVLVKSRRLRKN